MAKAEDVVYSQKTKATDVPVNSAPETTTGQFADVNEEISELAPAAVTMLALEDAELLEGPIAPDAGTYEPAGKKFTRSHSPRMNKDEPPSSSQETPDCSQQDNKKQRKTTHQLQISALELLM